MPPRESKENPAPSHYPRSQQQPPPQVQVTPQRLPTLLAMLAHASRETGIPLQSFQVLSFETVGGPLAQAPPARRPGA